VGGDAGKLGEMDEQAIPKGWLPQLQFSYLSPVKPL